MDKFGFSKGIFTLYEIDKQSHEQKMLVQDDNIIVNNSWLIISGLLNRDTNKFISSLALGDGGVINSELQSPTINDTNLYNELYRKTSIKETIIETILKPYYITFKFEIEELEGNGTSAQIYSEAGLMSIDGTMFSRKTFNEVLKTPEKKFVIDWKLEYTF